MISLKVLNDLQGLTQTEEMMIACVLPIMRVYIKPGTQRGAWDIPCRFIALVFKTTCH